MEQNGGFATLGYLYENVPKIHGVSWQSKTPFASIRRIVQDKHYFLRRFPSYISEVEHTTGFRNALLKFLELQDFNINMYVVSSDNRQREFTSKFEFEAFKPLKERTKFINYVQLSQWHSRAYELMLKERDVL
jgi:hypothetical protein